MQFKLPTNNSTCKSKICIILLNTPIILSSAVLPVYFSLGWLRETCIRQGLFPLWMVGAGTSPCLCLCCLWKGSGGPVWPAEPWIGPRDCGAVRKPWPCAGLESSLRPYSLPAIPCQTARFFAIASCFWNPSHMLKNSVTPQLWIIRNCWIHLEKILKAWYLLRVYAWLEILNYVTLDFCRCVTCVIWRCRCLLHTVRLRYRAARLWLEICVVKMR